ncbi:MAG: hypothetical protein ACPG7F_05380 [Aggregatilineales bacterium]
MGMGNEYEGGVKQRKSPLQAAIRPLMGLLVVIIGGVAAFFGSEPLADALSTYTGAIPADQADILQLIMGGLIFLLIVMIFAMIGAAFAPKPEKMATERQMEREKKEKEKERLAAKKRKKEMRAKMKAANRKKQRRS